MKNDFLRLLPSFDVISFDIFDTLLLRPLMDPQDVWRIVEQETGASGYAKARTRADAETYAAATKRGGETTLDEAYSILPRWKELREKELECEARLLVANPETVAFWNEAGKLGKKRVVVSDMYLPADFVKAQLRGCGIEGWDGFFLSSERGCRKTTGTLFKVMLDEMDVLPERVLHIGDNRQSDVAVPKGHGIAAVEYVKIRERFLSESPFLSDFLGAPANLNRRRIAGALMVGWHLYRCDHPDASYWERLGFLFGGVLGMAYLSFVAETARNNGIRQLLFVARDGWLMEQMFHKIAPEIATRYVYAPRGLANTASEKERKAYAEYIHSLELDDAPIGIVDSNTIHFSAQRLVSTVLGRPVFGIYSVAFRPVKNCVCFCYSPNMTLRWPNFAEFLFSAPTPPVSSVKDGAPVFRKELTEDERRRIALYPEVARGAMQAFQALLSRGITVSLEMWLDWFDAFAANLSVEDLRQLATIRHGENAEHTHLVPVITKGPPDSRWRRKWGLPLVRRHRFRRGLRLVTEDRLFGLFTFRNKEGDL